MFFTPRRTAARSAARIALVALAATALAGAASQHAHGADTAATAVASLRIGSNDAATGGDLSRYGYVILQSWGYGRIPTLKAANPNIKVIAYKNMTLTADYACKSGVDNAQLPSGVGYCWANTNHPDWFLTDTTGARIQSQYFTGQWMMDIGSAAYQNTWAQNVVADLKAHGFDGVMLDDANWSAHFHAGDRVIAKYPTQQAYQDASTSFLQNVCAQVRSAGLLALPNIQADASRSLRSQWAGYCSGSVKEYWVKWGTGTTQQKTDSGWAGELDQLQDAQAAGKIFLPITYAPTTDVRDMRFARASFLLGWDGSSTSALIYDVSGTDPWSSEWTASIGTPTGARFQVASGAWRRNFSGGVVLVNPSASASATVDLGGPYAMPDGSTVTSVTLDAASGLVLRTAGAATVTPPAPAPAPAPVAPATFGRSTVGGAMTSFQPADSTYVNYATLGSGTTLTTISAYLAGGGSGTASIRGVVYDDNGGNPGNLRAVTSTVTVAGSAGAGWVSLPLATPLALPAGSYWLGLQFGGSTNVVRVAYTPVASGQGRYTSDAFADGASSTFGAPHSDVEGWSVYATGSNVSITPVPPATTTTPTATTTTPTTTTTTTPVTTTSTSGSTTPTG